MFHRFEARGKEKRVMSWCRNYCAGRGSFRLVRCLSYFVHAKIGGGWQTTARSAAVTQPGWPSGPGLNINVIGRTNDPALCKP